MSEKIQQTFLLQYSTLILIVFSFVLVSSTLKNSEQKSLSNLLPRKEISQPQFLNSELQMPVLFKDNEVNVNSLTTIKQIVGNHDLNLHIELKGPSATEQTSLAIKLALALEQIGINKDSFSVKTGFDPQLKSELLKFSWSRE
jgi:hypothetical protein